MGRTLPAWPHVTQAARRQAIVSGSWEREIKLAVPRLDAVEARLQALQGAGAAYLGCVHERNHVLDTASAALKARHERLRLREIVGQPGVRVTWKGPAHVRGGVRGREEREFQADTYEACVAVLASLGLRVVHYYEKVRTSWQLDTVIVCLDRLPFVEIELMPVVGEREEAATLERAIALLDLHEAPRVEASYARLQQEWDRRRSDGSERAPRRWLSRQA